MARNKVESVFNHWTPLSQAEFNAMMLDFKNFCEKGSMIVNKNGKAVPFKLNEAQEVTAKTILKHAFAPTPSPSNIFIHKSRQMGISVLIAKIEQYLATRLSNFNAQHLMPTEPDADDLCDKKFIPQLQGTHPQLLPEATAITRRVKFKEFHGVKLNSSVTFSSAQQQAPGHGQTNQMVVEDEHAHYERVDRLERGMLATMPKMGLSIRIVVSTAYGLNHFYDLSKQAQSSPHWDYLFLPWHMLEEYEREPEGRLKDLTNLTDYELKLCDIFEAAGYPVEKWVRKMAWYEYTLHTEAKMDQEHMFENYPSTAEESFSATGAPVLPAAKLRHFLDNPKPFQYIEATSDISGAINITESTMSTIKRWETPTRGRKYIVGVDPAEGGSDGDFSAAVVIDLTTMENVCCIKEKLDQNEFAEVLNIIGRYYNNAQIVVERNTGQTLIDWLVMLRYPNIFVDAFKSTANRVVYGIYMTPSVKRDAIARAKFLLNADIYKDYDSEFLNSALHFVWKKTPSGLQKAIGSEGYSDDEVMARMVAFASLNMNKYRGWQNGKEG